MTNARRTTLEPSQAAGQGTSSAMLALPATNTRTALAYAPDQTSGTTALLPFTPGKELNREEKRIVAEIHRQTLIISGQLVKTKVGVSAIAAMHLHANGVFSRTTHEILSARDTGRSSRSKDHQAYLDLFTQRQMEMVGSNILTALDIGSANVLAEIQRTLNLEPEKRGLWQRLFGR